MSDFVMNGSARHDVAHKDMAILSFDAKNLSRAELERELLIYKRREEALCQYIVNLEEEVEREYARREQAEQALRDRDELLRQMVKHNPNATAVLDTTMTYLLVSDQFLAEYHIEATGVIGHHHCEVFPDVTQCWRDMYQRCLEGAVEYAHADSCASLDDSADDTCWECRPWYDADRQIGGLLLYTGVITRQKQAEAERQQLTEALQRQAVALRQSQALLHDVMNNSPIPISVNDMQGRYLLLNTCAAAMMGSERYEIIGKTDYDVLPYEVVRQSRAVNQQIVATGQTIESEEVLPFDDGLHTIISVKFPISDEQGDIYAIGTISTDITERKRTEAAHAALQEQVIAMQQAAIRELGTPLLPLAPGVIAMPLVGRFNSVRVQHVVETLLHGVAEHGARTVILDITGMSVVDTDVANALIQATQAVKLLGAQVVLTGVKPRIAQTIVELGVDMRGIITCGTLQAGIRYALQP